MKTLTKSSDNGPIGLRVVEANGTARVADARRSPDSIVVLVDLLRQVEVDDQRHIGNVYATAYHVS